MKKIHLRVLERINTSIPRSLLEGLLRTELAFPTLKQLAEAAIKSPSTPEDERVKFQNLLDSGYFNKTIQVVDTSIEQQISDYVDAKIKEAVDAGLLPEKINVPKLKSKSKKYVTETQKGSHPQ